MLSLVEEKVKEVLEALAVLDEMAILLHFEIHVPTKISFVM